MGNISPAGPERWHSGLSRGPGNFSTLYVGGPVNGRRFDRVTFTGGVTTPGGSGETIGIIPWIGGDRGASGHRDGGGRAHSTPTTRTACSRAQHDLLDRLHPGGDGEPLNGIFGDVTHNAITGNPRPVTGGDVALSRAEREFDGQLDHHRAATLTVSTGRHRQRQSVLFQRPVGEFRVGDRLPLARQYHGVHGLSRITGSGGLVVSSMSGGRAERTAAPEYVANTFTGGLYIAGTARVRFNASDAQLGRRGGDHLPSRRHAVVQRR